MITKYITITGCGSRRLQGIRKGGPFMHVCTKTSVGPSIQTEAASQSKKKEKKELQGKDDVCPQTEHTGRERKEGRKEGRRTCTLVDGGDLCGFASLALILELQEEEERRKKKEELKRAFPNIWHYK
jgi:hypothetical protein